MLSLEYILDFLAKMWGNPSEMVTLTIVTDSESAKIEREKEGRTIGTRPMLAPNQEIKLELKALEKRNRWIDREVKWVESHLEGKNEGYAYYNELNRIADELATEAREEVLQGCRKPGRHHIFPAARVGVKIRGQVVANKLTTIIKKQSGRRRLKKHLRTKNGWDDAVFEKVDWRAHGRAIGKLTWVKKIAVTKMIHRWLPTNVKKKMHRSIDDEKCKGCGDVETQEHMFRCPAVAAVANRKAAWKVLKRNMRKTAHEKVLEHMWYGLTAVFSNGDSELGPIYSREEESLKECFDDQSEIGWDNLVFGRISMKWAIANNDLRQRDGLRTINPTVFATKIIGELWQIGLTIWAHRNTVEHGTGYSISQLEKERVKNEVIDVYVNLKDVAKKEDEWLFKKTLDKKLSEKYDVQVAWLELLRRLYQYHNFEWYEEERRSRAMIEYVVESVCERSTKIW